MLLSPAIVPGVLTLIGIACVAALLVGKSARRCGIAFALTHVVANVVGVSIADWQFLFILNLLAMYLAARRPAGELQMVMAGLFLAESTQHLAYGLSRQTFYAEMVSWQVGVLIALTQAAVLLGYTGWVVGRRVGLGNALLRSGLVRLSHWTNHA